MSEETQKSVHFRFQGNSATDAKIPFSILKSLSSNLLGIAAHMKNVDKRRPGSTSDCIFELKKGSCDCVLSPIPGKEISFDIYNQLYTVWSDVASENEDSPYLTDQAIVKRVCSIIEDSTGWAETLHVKKDIDNSQASIRIHADTIRRLEQITNARGQFDCIGRLYRIHYDGRKAGIKDPQGRVTDVYFTRVMLDAVRDLKDAYAWFVIDRQANSHKILKLVALKNTAEIRSSTLLSAMNQVEEYRKLVEGWDGKVAPAIEKKSVEAARQLIVAVQSLQDTTGIEIKDVHVAPLTNGSLQVEFDNNEVYLEIECIDSTEYQLYRFIKEKKIQDIIRTESSNACLDWIYYTAKRQHG
jgi:hypothetical protein